MKTLIKFTCISTVILGMQASTAQANWFEKAADFVGKGGNFIGALFVPGYHAHPKAHQPRH